MLTLDVRKRRGEFALDVRIDAPPGVTALFGRSGCGKTTLIDMIAGLLSPDAGRIGLDDAALFDASRRVDVAPERRRIGYVFQDARLFPHYTVLGNLRYGERRAGVTNQRIEFDAVVALLALEPLLQRRPKGLSGGERQRVAIGRALLSQPRLLLLDEPLASLDRARRDEVLPYLERLRDELVIPMVYVSHQFDEVLQLASYVVLMDNGRVLAHGDVPSISMRAELRELVGAEAIGAVVEGRVTDVDRVNGFAHVTVGAGRLSIDAEDLAPGQSVRLQLLARDLILALDPPRGLSVRNALRGVVTRAVADGGHATLVEVDVGGACVVARITTPAAHDLAVRPGLTMWVLVKSMTLRGHVFHRPSH